MWCGLLSAGFSADDASAQYAVQTETSLTYAGLGTSLGVGYKFDHIRIFSGMNYLYSNNLNKGGWSTTIDYKPDSSSGKVFIRTDFFSYQNAQQNQLRITQGYAGYGHIIRIKKHWEINSGIGIGGYRERLVKGAPEYTSNGMSYCISLGFSYWQ